MNSEVTKKTLEVSSLQKKIKIIIITVLILVIGTVCLYNIGKSKALSTIPEDGIMKFDVKLDSVNLIQNDSVGNEWIFSGNVNGIDIKQGKTINLTTTGNEDISLSASAEEEDTYPDLGNGDENVNVSSLNLSKNNQKSIDVTVTEDRGRYSGNTANFKFNYSIIRKINFNDIVNNIF